MLAGLSTKQLAAALHISPHTVQDHLKAIFAKTRLRSRRQARLPSRRANSRLGWRVIDPVTGATSRRVVARRAGGWARDGAGLGRDGRVSGGGAAVRGWSWVSRAPHGGPGRL